MLKMDEEAETIFILLAIRATVRHGKLCFLFAQCY